MWRRDLPFPSVSTFTGIFKFGVKEDSVRAHVQNCPEDQDRSDRRGRNFRNPREIIFENRKAESGNDANAADCFMGP